VKIAIMQPYFLPYIGYWQLIAAVDKFIILDDVNYINRGWINRNRILCNQVPTWITLPLVGASQNKLICDLEILPDDGWRLKMEKLVTHSYCKAPYYDIIFPFFQRLLADAHGNLSDFLFTSISALSNQMQLKTEIIPTSRNFPKGDLRGQDRIIDICKQIVACQYVNPPGGRELYNSEPFLDAGISLFFLTPISDPSDVEPLLAGDQTLSILDLMMNNRIDSISNAILNLRIQP